MNKADVPCDHCDSTEDWYDHPLGLRCPGCFNFASAARVADAQERAATAAAAEKAERAAAREREVAEKRAAAEKAKAAEAAAPARQGRKR